MRPTQRYDDFELRGVSVSGIVSVCRVHGRAVFMVVAVSVCRGCVRVHLVPVAVAAIVSLSLTVALFLSVSMAVVVAVSVSMSYLSMCLSVFVYVHGCGRALSVSMFRVRVHACVHGRGCVYG